VCHALCLPLRDGGVDKCDARHREDHRRLPTPLRLNPLAAVSSSSFAAQVMVRLVDVFVEKTVTVPPVVRIRGMGGTFG